MRVITGTARGRRLETLPGNDVRPTVERVKEALFSAVQFEIENAEVLDLFAGSGQLGIEALSRGARLAVFVDAARPSCEVVKRNLASTGLAPGARVVQMDALAYLRSTRETFDLAFLDPPYQSDLLTEALPLLAGRMSGAGIILCETPKKLELPQRVGAFAVSRRYQYASTAITQYRREETA